jgi:hypothetical protein
MESPNPRRTPAGIPFRRRLAVHPRSGSNFLRILEVFRSGGGAVSREDAAAVRRGGERGHMEEEAMAPS